MNYKTIFSERTVQVGEEGGGGGEMGRGAVAGFTHCTVLGDMAGPYGSGLPSTTENCEYGLRPRYIGDQSSSPLATARWTALLVCKE